MRQGSELRVALLCVVAGLQTWAGVVGELVLLVTLTRHGSRAPNPVIDELCPADATNRAKYNVPPGQLTANGMKQGFQLGTFLRETYVEGAEFLPPSLGAAGDPSFSSKFMSDSAERCLQTAQAMGMGLFPNGTGPPGFPIQPIAVQTEQKQFANMLAAAHGACLPQQKADNAAYDSSRGKDLIEKSRSITDVVAKACGTPVEHYASADKGKEGLVLGVKDVADMLDFDEQQGLPRLADVSQQAHKDMTQLAFTLLQERYYSNRRQITYWAGDFPTTLLNDLVGASRKHNEGKKPDRLYLGYHGHRELLYGVAHLLGWSFDVPGAPTALGTSSIPPAATMLFELHHRYGEPDDEADEADETETDDGSSSTARTHREKKAAAEEGYYYVRTYTWTPDFGQQEVVLDACSSVGAGQGCLLATFEAIVQGSKKDTGTWQEICHHVPFVDAEKIAQKAVFLDVAKDGMMASSVSGARSSTDQLLNFVTVVGAMTCIAAMSVVARLGVIAVKSRWQGAWAGRGGEAYHAVP